MTPPPIRTVGEAARAIGLLWQSVFMGDTIVRYRTTSFAVQTAARAKNGEAITFSGGSLGSVVAGAVNRAPANDVAIPVDHSLVVASDYRVSSGYDVTVEATAELRVL